MWECLASDGIGLSIFKGTEAGGGSGYRSGRLLGRFRSSALRLPLSASGDEEAVRADRNVDQWLDRRGPWPVGGGDGD